VEKLQVRARALIVGGWAILLFGSVAYFAVLIHQGYFSAGQSLAFEGEIVLPVLGNTAALVAWWWLTRLRVEDDQMVMVRRACYAFGLQALLIAGSVLSSVSLAESAVSPNQLAASTLIVQSVGGLTVFVGFVVFAGAFTPRRELPREAPRVAGFAQLEDDDDE